LAPSKSSQGDLVIIVLEGRRLAHPVSINNKTALTSELQYVFIIPHLPVILEEHIFKLRRNHGYEPQNKLWNQTPQQAAGYQTLRCAGLFNLPIPLRFAFGIGVSTIETL
jgi:hypothetical protein